jgi:hypothetical protein
MAVFSIVGFFGIIKSLIDAENTPGDIVDYGLNLITIAVPPALPAAMTIGTVLSL